jgi:hypothetical protein
MPIFLGIGKVADQSPPSPDICQTPPAIHPKPPGISGAHEDFAVREYGKTHCVHQIFHAKRADLLVDHRVGGAVEIGRQSAI